VSHTESLLEQIGLRLDAKYTAALDQQLEFLRTKTYDVQYPELKARKLIPVDISVDSGAETISYQQWDSYGMAEIIANYANDLPMVDVKAEKFSTPVVSLGEAYQYSIQDLRRATMAGNSLDMRRATAVRRAIELKIDAIAATGDPKTQLKGLINHPNVAILTAATDGTSTRWVGGRTTPKAPELIKADMNTTVSAIRVATLETQSPDTLLMPTTEFAHISDTSINNVTDISILKSFMNNGSWVTNVDSWYKLATADAAGTGPRMDCYRRDPEILQLVIPQDFESLPPQAKNLTFVVNTHARIGGVVVYYPLAIEYMDGI
jgi:hypothetical protein